MIKSPTVLDEPELLILASWSFFALLPPRENIDPNICTLSGLSERTDGILLVFDRLDDFRERLRLSVEAEVESRERKEEEADDSVLDLELLPKIELLFICAV
jgi:GTPase SAR1 family protein